VAGGGVAALIPRPPPRRSVGVGVAPEARGAEREDVPRRVVERDEALDLAEGGVEVDATPMAAAGDRAARLSRRQPKRIPCCSLFACVVVDHLIGVLFHSKFHG
jgi:hypothetical protein